MTFTGPTRMQPLAFRYEPLIICTCGTSLHDTASNRAMHEDSHHCAARPADFHMASRAEHEAAGWDTGPYPQFVTC